MDKETLRILWYILLIIAQCRLIYWETKNIISMIKRWKKKKQRDNKFWNYVNERHGSDAIDDIEPKPNY